MPLSLSVLSVVAFYNNELSFFMGVSVFCVGNSGMRTCAECVVLTLLLSTIFCFQLMGFMLGRLYVMCIFSSKEAEKLQFSFVLSLLAIMWC